MIRQRLRGFLAGALFGSFWFLGLAKANGDLGADVKALLAARVVYGRLVHLRPRLVERGDVLPLAIAPELLEVSDPSCTTVTVLGVPELHFVIRFPNFDRGTAGSAFQENSAAGAFEVTRCGAGKRELSELLLELRSPRGVVETLISNAPAGVPPLLEVLPGRDPGADLPLGDPGPPPPGAPLARRLEQLLARAARESAIGFERTQLLATDDGSGGAQLPLAMGCHELSLLDETQPSRARPRVDVDLELFGEESAAPLVVDRSEDSDARASLCVGARTSVELRFAGAAPAAKLLLIDAHFNLPAGVPSSWGPDARAKLAELSRAQHFNPTKGPIYQSLGVQGTTQLALEVEPDACYTVLIAPLRGEVQSLSLSESAMPEGESARGAADVSGSALAFCAEGATKTSLEIDGRGTSLTWILAAWETGRSAPGATHP